MGYTQADYDPSTILKEISGIVPFFAVYAGRAWRDGKQWPVKADGTDTKILHQETFKRGKGKFHHFEFEESREIKAHQEAFPYIITTNRELEHYNSGTMTRRTRNASLLTEDVLMIHPEDAGKNRIKDGDLVVVESARGKIKIKASITDEVKPGVLSSTFHFPEINLNVLGSNEHDVEALCPEYKVVAVRIRKYKGEQEN